MNENNHKDTPENKNDDCKNESSSSSLVQADTSNLNNQSYSKNILPESDQVQKIKLNDNATVSSINNLNPNQTVNKSVTFSEVLKHEEEREDDDIQKHQRLIENELINFQDSILKIIKKEPLEEKINDLKSAKISSSHLVLSKSSLDMNEDAPYPIMLETKIIAKSRSPSLEKTEKKSRTSIVTPADSNAEHSSEKDPVGDNTKTNKTQAHIHCECETSCAGAAVPVVVSFIVSDNDTLQKPDNITNSTSIERNDEEITAPDSCIEQLVNVNPSQPLHNNETNQMFDREVTQKESALASPSVPDFDNKNESQKTPKHEQSNARRSLIPKLIKNEKRSRNSSLDIKTKTTQEAGTSGSFDTLSSKASSIISKLDVIQTELNSITTNIQQRIQSKKKTTFQTEKNISYYEERNKTFDTKNSDSPINRNQLLKDFYKSVSEIKKIADVLSTREDYQNQSEIEGLYTNILKIKNIINKFEQSDANNEDNESLSSTLSLEDRENQSQSERAPQTKTQDNKISIKLLSSKLNCKRKSPNKVVGAEADLSKLCPEGGIYEQIVFSEKKNAVKRTDSMDGIFIPSEPPVNNMDDDDEDGEGLDITITFKEFKSAALEADSRLSVCLSDLSAEALGNLKRCPKNFTLRMDFVTGKMVLKRGTAPASSFSLSDNSNNAKPKEDVIDTNKSDIISLKPSTECTFTSIIIPVENAQKISSVNSLKGADPEVFSVVSLPFMQNRQSLTTRSCSAVKSNFVLSKRLLLEQGKRYRSMPQIESLQNIYYESSAMDNACIISSPMHVFEKKRKHRLLQRKIRGFTSTDRL